MSPLNPLYIAVCGPGVASPEEEALAEEVGRRVARAGAVLVCGGMTGVMDAAAQGAEAEDGVSIGILPGPDLHGCIAVAKSNRSILQGLEVDRDAEWCPQLVVP